jgi:hypothetical protein
LDILSVLRPEGRSAINERYNLLKLEVLKQGRSLPAPAMPVKKKPAEAEGVRWAVSRSRTAG